MNASVSWNCTSVSFRNAQTSTPTAISGASTSHHQANGNASRGDWAEGNAFVSPIGGRSVKRFVSPANLTRGAEAFDAAPSMRLVSDKFMTGAFLVSGEGAASSAGFMAHAFIQIGPLSPPQ